MNTPPKKSPPHPGALSGAQRFIGPKTPATPRPRAPRPQAPPAYRPQPPAPRVLQAKKAVAGRPTPPAPPVYRPQPAPKILQAKPASPTTPPRPSPLSAPVKRAAASPPPQARPPRWGAVQLYTPTTKEKKEIPGLRKRYIDACDPNDYDYYSTKFDELVESAGSMAEIRTKVAEAEARKALKTPLVIPTPTPTPTTTTLPPTPISGLGGSGSTLVVIPPTTGGGSSSSSISSTPKKPKFRALTDTESSMVSFKSTPPPITTTTTVDVYGGLTGNARALAQTIEADRVLYNTGKELTSPRYKSVTHGTNGMLYNYGHGSTYTSTELDAVGYWWSGRSNVYEYIPPGPKDYNTAHDVANFLFHHPTGRSFNFHGQKQGPKS